MAVISRKHSWVPGSLDVRLPPIKEVSATSPVPSSTSPRSSKTSHRREPENPFRRNSRHTSVTVPTSSSMSDSLVSQKARRATFLQRKSLSAVDLAKSEKIMKQLELRRRSSILNIMPDGKRASFGTVGRRITTLLKAKNAFTRLRKRQTIIEDDTIETEKEFEIKEMPPVPRFASKLSPEAQYAVMKGYEDVVYSNLCQQYPEYRPMLRRNRTPLTGVSVKSVKEKYGKMFETKNMGEEMGKSHHGSDDIAVDTVDSRDGSGPASASTPKPEDVPITSARELMNTSPVPVLSSGDQSPRATQNASPGSRNAVNTKTKTLPEVHNKEKQLVMTYRYQRAMDILDSLREHQGLHPLSPRKKENRQIEPLKEYNSWSHVWTHEFEPK